MTRGLAGELALRRPDAVMVALTDSLPAGPISRPPNLEIISLPANESGERFSNLLPAPGSGFEVRGLPALHEALIHETARAFDPHIIVVENHPASAHGELARTLATMQAQAPRPVIVLGLHTAFAEQAVPPVVGIDDDARHLLTDAYSRVIVFSDPTLYQHRAMTPAQVDVCGFIAPPAPTEQPESVRRSLNCEDRPLVVAYLEHGEHLETYLNALREPGLDLERTVSLIIAGPQLRAEEIERLQAVHSSVIAIRDVANLVNQLNAADVVVTSGGERALLDAIGLHKRVVAIPGHDQAMSRQRYIREFAELGLVTLVKRPDLTPERLGRAIRDGLDAGTSPPELLDFTGLRRAGDILAETLERLAPLWSPRALRPSPSLARARAATTPLSSPGDPTSGQPTTRGWDGSHFYIDPDSLIERDIFETGGFEKELQMEMALLLLPGDAVLDCGANIGAYACPFARRVGPDGIVIAVEPVPFLADRLEANVRLNRLQNLFVVRKAVSSTAGVRPMFAPEPDSWNRGAGSLYAGNVTNGTAIDVETIMIDDLVDAFGLTSLRLIKLDIEGHEVDALLGAGNVLRNLRPYVFFEYLPHVWNEAGRTLVEALDLLRGEYGYQVRPVDWQASEGFRMMMATPPQR